MHSAFHAAAAVELHKNCEEMIGNVTGYFIQVLTCTLLSNSAIADLLAVAADISKRCRSRRHSVSTM